jgi:hypothetical protein
MVVLQKRGPSKGYFHTFVSDAIALLISKERYVEALENKVEKLGKLIRQVSKNCLLFELGSITQGTLVMP